MDMETTLNFTELKNWWDNIAFEGKDKYQLQENGELTYGGGRQPRTVATLTYTEAENTYKALTEKYNEAAGKVKELETEWVSADDKLKLHSKLEKLKEYLEHVNAAGDMQKLHALVADWEKTSTELLEENYKARLKIAEAGEALVANENFKETTQAYKDLAEQWKSAGYLDKQRSDALWNRLEAAKNKFYERKREHKEAYDKEMLQNLDLKMELVEKAEALAVSEEWKKATEAYKEIMDQWKATGPTMHDKNEALWNRLIAAKSNFFDRKKLHFEDIQKEQEANYTVKLGLTEKAEALKENTDWANTAQAYTDLMEQWKHTGRIPAEKGDELWNRFSAAKDFFFKAKKQHFEDFRSEMEENYKKKSELLKRAEGLKNSTRWHEATQELNDLMTEWKKTGPVTRSQSKKIWDEFIAARKHFFDRKDANRDHRKQTADQHKKYRQEQAYGLLMKLESEIAEEHDRIADFKNGLLNLTTGKKEEELRKHLNNLINEGEIKIKQKQQKLENLRKEMDKKGEDEATAENTPE
jgi:hypothetical protein